MPNPSRFDFLLRAGFKNLHYYALGGENFERPRDAFSNLRTFAEEAVVLIAPRVGVDLEEVRTQLEVKKGRKFDHLPLNDSLAAIAPKLTRQEKDDFLALQDNGNFTAHRAQGDIEEHNRTLRAEHNKQLDCAFRIAESVMRRCRGVVDPPPPPPRDEEELAAARKYYDNVVPLNRPPLSYLPQEEAWQSQFTGNRGQKSPHERNNEELAEARKYYDDVEPLNRPPVSYLPAQEDWESQFKRAQGQTNDRPSNSKPSEPRIPPKPSPSFPYKAIILVGMAVALFVIVAGRNNPSQFLGPSPPTAQPNPALPNIQQQYARPIEARVTDIVVGRELASDGTIIGGAPEDDRSLPGPASNLAGQGWYDDAVPGQTKLQLLLVVEGDFIPCDVTVADRKSGHWGCEWTNIPLGKHKIIANLDGILAHTTPFSIVSKQKSSSQPVTTNSIQPSQTDSAAIAKIIFTTSGPGGKKPRNVPGRSDASYIDGPVESLTITTTYSGTRPGGSETISATLTGPMAALNCRPYQIYDAGGTYTCRFYNLNRPGTYVAMYYINGIQRGRKELIVKMPLPSPMPPDPIIAARPPPPPQFQSAMLKFAVQDFAVHPSAAYVGENSTITFVLQNTSSIRVGIALKDRGFTAGPCAFHGWNPAISGISSVDPAAGNEYVKQSLTWLEPGSVVNGVLSIASPDCNLTMVSGLQSVAVTLTMLVTTSNGLQAIPLTAKDVPIHPLGAKYTGGGSFSGPGYFTGPGYTR